MLKKRKEAKEHEVFLGNKILRTIHCVSEANCFLLQVKPLTLKHNSPKM
jgi:hypothetical protein